MTINYSEFLSNAVQLGDHSFATAVSEVTRGTSAGSAGKGHVKSASVSSPGGPSAENGGAPVDPLASRYPTYRHFKHGHFELSIMFLLLI